MLNGQGQSLREGGADCSCVCDDDDVERAVAVGFCASELVFDAGDGERDAVREIGKAFAVGRAMGCRRVPQVLVLRAVVGRAFPVAEVLFVEFLFFENLLFACVFFLQGLRCLSGAEEGAGDPKRWRWGGGQVLCEGF